MPEEKSHSERVMDRAMSLFHAVVRKTIADHDKARAGGQDPEVRTAHRVASMVLMDIVTLSAALVTTRNQAEREVRDETPCEHYWGAGDVPCKSEPVFAYRPGAHHCTLPTKHHDVGPQRCKCPCGAESPS